MPHRLDIDLDELASVCRRYGIRELFVFGSALRADFSQASDIDLLVEYEPGVRLGFLQYFALKEEFEQLFGRPVDLVEGRSRLTNPFRRKSILESMERVYAA